MTHTPTTEERIWSAISHASALLFGVGLVFPLITWGNFRAKSPYAAFQALQALGYQVLGFTVWFLLILLVILFWVLASIPFYSYYGSLSGQAFYSWIAVLIALIAFTFFLYIVFPLIATVTTALGKEYHYPILGKRLAAYLHYDPGAAPDAAFEEQMVDRWIAANNHFAVIIFIWGMLAPLLAWIMFKERSLFLKFQSLQTLIYQAAGTMLFGILAFLYIAGTGIMVVVIALMDSSGADATVPLLVFFLLFLCFGGFFTLFLPLFQVLGQWAGLRILRGDDYRYPLIARLADKFVDRQKLHDTQDISKKNKIPKQETI